MYDKCLRDIELAIKANHPKLSKLEQRREDCVKLMATTEQFENRWPKLELSFEADKTFPQLANVVEIVCNDKYGRHIIAKTDIPVGKTILIEKAFLSKMPPAASCEPVMCDTCLKTSMNFVPCDKCTVLFCDTDCMDRNAFHKFECDNFDSNLSIPISILIRSVLTAIEAFPNVDNLIEEVENVVKRQVKELPRPTSDLPSKYLEFLNLHCHLSSEKWEDMLHFGYIAHQYLMSQNTLKEMFATKHQKNFLMHLLVYHSSIITSNSFKRNNGIIGFILGSYFNHSCAPNVLQSDNGDKRLMISLRPIKTGQQLYMRYLEEKDDLSENFGFLCECEKCKLTVAVAPRKLPITNDLMYLTIMNETTPNDRQFDKNESLKIEKACINILTKYGSYVWNEELEFVADMYAFLLNGNNL